MVNVPPVGPEMAPVAPAAAPGLTPAAIPGMAEARIAAASAVPTLIGAAGIVGAGALIWNGLKMIVTGRAPWTKK